MTSRLSLWILFALCSFPIGYLTYDSWDINIKSVSFTTKELEGIAQLETLYQQLEVAHSNHSSAKNATKADHEIIFLMNDALDKSNLILDPEVESFYRMYILYLQLPELLSIVDKTSDSNLLATKILSLKRNFKKINKHLDASLTEPKDILHSAIQQRQELKQELSEILNHRILSLLDRFYFCLSVSIFLVGVSLVLLYSMDLGIRRLMESVLRNTKSVLGGANVTANTARKIFFSDFKKVNAEFISMSNTIASEIKRRETVNAVLEKTLTNEKAARIAAQEAANSKKDFLARMSHEIRTPLNAIFGYINLSLESQSEKEIKENLEIVLSFSKHLLSIINDILDFSKISSNRLELSPTAVLPDDLLNDVFHILRGSAQVKKLEFTISTENLPPRLLLDDVRVKQILLNLTSNAIKFTSQGYVKINARYSNNSLIVDVEDTGLGIVAEKMGKLFQEFEQLSSGIAREYGGSGLGLAISQALAKLMGGIITVTSTEGAGSIFTATMPCPLAPESTAPKIEETTYNSAAPVAFQRQILIVDDNPINIRLLKIILQKNGFTVCTSANGLQAFEACKEQQFDMIFMDLEMPVMDGIQSSQAIRSSELSKNKETPIIALTAHAFDDFKHEALAVGMNDFITKPFQTEEIFETIYKAKIHGHRRA